MGNVSNKADTSQTNATIDSSKSRKRPVSATNSNSSRKRTPHNNFKVWKSQTRPSTRQVSFDYLILTVLFVYSVH